MSSEYPEPIAVPRGVPRDVYAGMIRLRRDIHRAPELSGHEQATAARIVAELDRLGLRYRTGVGGHGVIAEIPGRGSGPAVGLRADLDALPIHEETGLSFASAVPGVMHACGHDGHSALLLGAAELLLAGEPPPAPVRLIWQPSEERGKGALRMITDGALDGLGMIFGGHLDRHYPAPMLVVTEGAVNASTDGFEIRIEGQQGHGGRPHESVDAVLVGSLIVMALQSIVSREVDPTYPSVVSVGVFQAGTAPNVIAGTAELSGTIRAQHPEVRDHLRRSVRRIAESAGLVHGARVSVQLFEGAPPLINRPEATAVARAAAVAVVGAEQVAPLRTANMGGEDFAFYLDHVPGCYIRYGARVAGREGYPAHSSRFDFDERALATGAAWMAEVARRAGAHLTTG